MNQLVHVHAVSRAHTPQWRLPTAHTVFFVNSTKSTSKQRQHVAQESCSWHD